MSAVKRYAIDTDILIHFSSSAKEVEKDPSKKYTKEWFKSSIAQTYCELFSTPTVMVEFIIYLHYNKKTETKKIRAVIRTLTRSFDNFAILPQGLNEVCDICQNIEKILSNLECHIGEFSLLPYLTDPDVTFVSADRNALKAFKMANRINPTRDPPVEAYINEDYVDD